MKQIIQKLHYNQITIENRTMGLLPEREQYCKPSMLMSALQVEVYSKILKN